jgi:hypothetical protein
MHDTKKRLGRHENHTLLARGESFMKTPGTRILLYLFIFLIFLFPISGVLHAQTFTGPELLARPTNNSVTVHVVNTSALQVYFDYGTAPGSYAGQTGTSSAAANEPIKAVINGLQPNTKYYYRMAYSTNGGTTWSYGSEHSFYTQRAQGSTFTFTVTSDSHVNVMLGDPATWQTTLANVAADHPDFHIDCGDTFNLDSITTAQGARDGYLFQRSSTYFGGISHSIPIFLAIGNHEQEEGWHISDPAGAVAVWCRNARKRYFPNPVPDSFYSGNTDTYSGLDDDDLHEDYYAWNWGDALFIVLDPFWYTTTKPFAGNTGGGESSDTGDGDRWHWTLGDTQYNWLKSTLENSNAKYKFLFMHQPTGGTDDYIRGGAAAGTYCEWGGNNEDGTTWAFNTKRPTWPKTIHQILIDSKASAVFHGHDHQYAYELRDGIVYQEIPSGGFTGNGFNGYTTGVGYTVKALPSSGHLRVTVTPEEATVNYIRSGGTGGSYSYTIEPYTNPTPSLYGDTEPKDCDVDGSDIAAYIIAGGYPGNMELFAANFGKTSCQ